MPFYKTEVVVTVVSTEPLGDFYSLEALEYSMNYGQAMGTWEVNDVNVIDEEELKHECELMGGDYEYFLGEEESP